MPLALGFDGAVERLEEDVAGVDEVKLVAEADLLEGLDHPAALVLAHHAVVDVHQQTFRPEGIAEDRCRDRRVDTTGGEEEDGAVAHLLPNPLPFLSEEALHGPVRTAAADVQHEVADHRLAVERVVDLGVELESVAPMLVRRDRREPMVRMPVAARRVAGFLESRAYRHHRVVVAHEDLFDRSEILEDGGVADDVQLRLAPLAAAVHDLAAVVLGDLLVPEAEAEDRNVEVEDLAGVVGVLAVRGQARASRDDDAAVALEDLDRIFGLADLGEYAEAAHFGSDQVRVLPTEIDDSDGIV